MSVYSQARLSPDRPSLALPCNALAELVIFLRLAKDTTIKAGCWESYCSEGLGAQGNRTESGEAGHQHMYVSLQYTLHYTYTYKHTYA